MVTLMKSATSEVHISALEYLGLFNGYMDESKIHVYVKEKVSLAILNIMLLIRLMG